MIEDNDVKHMHKLNYEQFKTIFIKKEQERIATIRGAAKGTMSVRDRIGPAKGVKGTASVSKYKTNFNNEGPETTNE